MLVRMKDVLAMAERDNKAVGMFNTTGLDSLQAVIGAAEELGEPVIIAHAEVHNTLNDIGLVGPAMIAAARNAKVPVCVHLDHGETLEMVERALSLGFTSIMIDASSLPYAENVRITRDVVTRCHSMGVDVEAELGKLPTHEGGASDGSSRPSDFYTDPEQAREFVQSTGIDALAVAFGTAHGFYKEKPVLDFDVVRECRKTTGLPLVMHGGSGVSAEDFSRSIDAGIRKINYYSYMSKAGYEAARNVIRSESTAYFHDVVHAAMLAMKEDAKKAMRIFSKRQKKYPMNYRLGWLLVVASACLLGACSRGEQVSVKELAAHFADPPRESRPMVWWHWMNGNITKDGIRKDLEWMDRAGIRGFHHFDAALQTPQVVDNRLIYMTPEWKDAFRYALEVADSLDMEVGIASSPGWSHSGGPWVKQKDAMKKVVWREMQLPGGSHFEGPLPDAFTDPCFFQNAKALEYLEVKAPEEGYYEDIAVLALKLPEEDKPLVPSSIRTSGGKFTFADLSDGDLLTGGKVEAKDGACWIEYHFDHPITVRSLIVADQGGRGPISFKADGKEITNFPLSAVSEQTISFEPVTASVFRLDITLIPRSMLLQLLGLNPAEGGVGLTEFRLSGVSRVNRAEAKAAFTNLENLNEYPTPQDGINYYSEVQDLTDNYKNGILTWDIPEGNWKVFRFGWSLTGKMNAPAPAEATGLEVDKLDPEAWEHYFKQYLDMYKDAAGGSLDKIDYMLNDSWEAGNANWTPSLPAAFKARRGYDLLPWMPALTGHVVGSAEATEKFLLDWRETLEELLAENFDRLTDLLHSYGLKGRYSESHEGGRAMVADGMDIKRRADVPMSAIWTPGVMMGSPIVTALADMRESSSVSHIYGQKYVAAESMTAVGLNGQAYSYYPGNLKPVVDLEFASGVNRIIVHESAHQPLDDFFPGVSLSITGQWFNRHETWAEQAKPWTDYLARTSYLLSEGRNVADFLVYYGEDTNVTARYADGEIGLPKGYNYDFVNPYALLNVIEYKNGCFVAPSGNSWKVLVLDADFISDKIQQRLDVWKTAGARICTLNDLDCCGIAPDVETSTDIRYVHRSIREGEIYWISKPSDKFETVSLSFRCSGLVPSIWNAETGEIHSVSYTVEHGRTVVEIPMTPNDAKFVVFAKQSMGKRPVILSESEESLALDGPWSVRFQEGRGAPASVLFPELISYTESKDPGIKYFSGTATYTTVFTLSELPEHIILDLGDVQNIAEVIVNGHPVRTLWKVPYKADITDYATIGTNALAVRVTNLWPNRLIRDAQLPEGERLTHTTYPFYCPDDPLRDGGLIGPAQIILDNSEKKE